ncbi:Acg family FMN-binding oxidoreductase [Plantactinospora sp. KLBMP9567]|uniref:Acg family FMN-binding oxidoreductase n=1 Tax=Plantactinospora sp. KLBMP9567 TaxID=3085900 RepID=UPI0029825CA4|nr:nitroreductase [Plantactinospora sp. KLBMP9567]MDW5325949.1 nitroreductase [Plantactinospora sp. KLBMP9567]
MTANRSTATTAADGSGVPAAEARAAFGAAAAYALLAPSVFNTQPWRWRIGPGAVLTLRADRSRQVHSVDASRRLLLVSCGAALHHARLALAAAGYRTEVVRSPDGADPDVLARITVTGRQDVDPERSRQYAAGQRRRTDRRAFGDRSVAEPTLRRLREVVEAEGAHLHLVRDDQMPMLAVATANAAAVELEDPAYRAELRRWTNRPPESRDGVPAASAVRPGLRRVPIREHALGGTPGLEVGDGMDRGAAYAILFGTGDAPADLLTGGEALSALLLTAVAEGLATAPLSDPIELDWPRWLMRNLLADIGEPYVVVRLGFAADPTPLPPVLRREPADVIGYAD